MLSGPYVVNNKVHMKSCPSKKLFNIHVRGKKYQSNKKWPWLGLLKIRSKIWSFNIHSCWLNFLLQFFSIHIYIFSIMYHILNLYIKILKWNHNKKCIWMLMLNPYYNPYVHFKSPLLYDWCMFIEFHPSINIFIQVGNFNP
jgi:hypothetical protein